MTSPWDGLESAIAEARALVAAEAPDAALAAEGEAYIARVVTASLSEPLLGHLLREGGLSRALPSRGGPNPDYRMHHAAVEETGRYRLEGRLNQSERVGVGLYIPDRNGGMLEAGYAIFEAHNCPDGAFALDIAADVSGPGTLTLQPGCRVLLIRTLHRDPRGEPARMTLSGGASAPGLALATGSLEGALGRVSHGLVQSVTEYLKWTRAVVAHPNRLESAPPELAATVQGDPDTSYFLGSYDLGEGEWLEVTMPEKLPGYWSLHAYNYWFEGLQVEGAHDRNALADPDGRIRVRIGPAVPARLVNRIDTLGRRRGALICRILGAGRASQPQARIATRRSEPSESP